MERGPARLDSLLCFNLYLGWRAVQGFYRPHFASDLNPQRVYVLTVLDDDREATVSEVAAALHIDMPAVSGLLDRMEQDGLLVRRRADDNRREVKVSLTAKGKAVRDENARVAREANKVLFRHVAERDLPALRRIVRGILAAETDGEDGP